VKKVVISSGGKQYLVSEGETLDIDLLKNPGKSIKLDSLLLIDGDKASIGKPKLTNESVVAEVVEPEIKAEKVVAIRYKAKKRVRKIRGHRQRHTRIKITKII
jgi:large subunit ribosomal protein L21